MFIVPRQFLPGHAENSHELCPKSSCSPTETSMQGRMCAARQGKWRQNCQPSKCSLCERLASFGMKCKAHPNVLKAILWFCRTGIFPLFPWSLPEFAQPTSQQCLSTALYLGTPSWGHTHVTLMRATYNPNSLEIHTQISLYITSNYSSRLLNLGTFLRVAALQQVLALP